MAMWVDCNDDEIYIPRPQPKSDVEEDLEGTIGTSFLFEFAVFMFAVLASTLFI